MMRDVKQLRASPLAYLLIAGLALTSAACGAHRPVDALSVTRTGGLGRVPLDRNGCSARFVINVADTGTVEARCDCPGGRSQDAVVKKAVALDHAQSARLRAAATAADLFGHQPLRMLCEDLEQYEMTAVSAASRVSVVVDNCTASTSEMTYLLSLLAAAMNDVDTTCP